MSMFVMVVLLSSLAGYFLAWGSVCEFGSRSSKVRNVARAELSPATTCVNSPLRGRGRRLKRGQIHRNNVKGGDLLRKVDALCLSAVGDAGAELTSYWECIPLSFMNLRRLALERSAEVFWDASFDLLCKDRPQVEGRSMHGRAGRCRSNAFSLRNNRSQVSQSRTGHAQANPVRAG
jgi:hypothetical protein